MTEKATKRSAGKSGPQHANQRGAARLSAVQALYQMDIGDVTLEETLAQFAPRLKGVTLDDDTYLPADADYFGQIVRGVLKNQIEIDPLIDSTLPATWPVQRIDATLRALLRAGAFEILHKPDVPKAVVISEYVDVANAFFDEGEPGLVNGVLDKLARTMQDRT